jgi:release factor glutamine methyltransferase
MLFYLPISNYAQSALREGGRLYFEINPRYDEQIEDILLGLGFDDIVKREDQFGRTRFIRATWH